MVAIMRLVREEEEEEDDEEEEDLFEPAAQGEV
jgi:hypothetical protein